MAWQTYFTDISGKRALVMLDRRYATRAPSSELSRLVWVCVYCHTVPSSGFWDPAETESLDCLEDVLLAISEARLDGWGVYLRRVATPGIREYYLYVADHVDFDGVTQELRERFSEYRIEQDHRQDPTWKYYQKWLKEPTLPLE